ncbi:MAG TPA: hypothetical protein VJ576_02555 [Rhodocyclaceae bacterium]|nr:hypothetical protein [Rhodocyclaceae bacterium]
MANCIIAYPNRADEATLSGGAWSAGLPLDNLKTRFLGEVARSADAALASTLFQAVFVRQRMVRIVAIIGHTMSGVAQYRLRLWSDAGKTQLTADTGWQFVWPAIYPPTALEWEFDEFWDGTIQEEDRIGLTWTLPIVLAQPQLATVIQLEFNDTGNTAGYIDIGRLFVAGEWQPVMNHSYGASLGYEDETGIEKALLGVKHFDGRRPYRVAQFAVEHMSVDEGLSRPFDMQRRQGISKEVFYMYDPEDTVHLLRRAFLGRLRKLSPLEFPYFDNTRTQFEIEEIV